MYRAESKVAWRAQARAAEHEGDVAVGRSGAWWESSFVFTRHASLITLRNQPWRRVLIDQLAGRIN